MKLTMTAFGVAIIFLGGCGDGADDGDFDGGFADFDGGRPLRDSGPPDGGRDASSLDASPSDGGPGGMQLYPIDRGGEDGAPADYLGLPLGLATQSPAVITPISGRIGLVCVGMSNARQECNELLRLVEDELADSIASEVTIVNCAVSGMGINAWAQSDTLWDLCIESLPSEGLSVDQVRVLYHKAANAERGGFPSYPDPDSNYFRVFNYLGEFATRAAAKFPNLQGVFTTSRAYGGFTRDVDRGEPRSYEEGHALNTWLAANPVVDGVWHGWGAYIWAPSCDTELTNASGTCYERGDFNSDGVHPSPAGREKIARLFHARLLQESWYAR